MRSDFLTTVTWFHFCFSLSHYRALENRGPLEKQLTRHDTPLGLSYGYG
jgi:hypothetical protein